MKRGCQEKVLAIDRPTRTNRFRGSQPHFRRARLSSRYNIPSVPHHYSQRLCPETEKRRGPCMATTVLFEPQRANAFPGHARGDRVGIGSSTEAVTIRPEDPHPRPCVPNSHHRRIIERVVVPANRSERLCRPIQFLWIERFSFLPNRQGDRRDLPRQRQPRHFLSHTAVFQSLQITEIWLPWTASGRRAHEYVLQNPIAIRIHPRVAIGLRLCTTRPSLNSYSELICVTTAKPL